MRTIKHWALAAAAASALALAGCGGGGSGGTASTPTETPPPTPSPVAAMGDVMLSAAAQAALLTVLPDSGSSDTIEIAAGETAERAGVTFSCDSAYACTVTVTNSLGTIVAAWSSQTLGDGTAGVMASLPPPPHVPVSTFAELNPANAATVRGLVTTPTTQPTELTGMGLGGMGVANADMAGLRSSFDPNTANATGTPGAPGATNGLMGGSTLTGAMDGIDASADMASAPAGWAMKVLFRDWGDTAGTGDGGFETGAIVVKNHEGPTSHAWDADLAGRFVNTFSLDGIMHAGDNPYAFTVRRDGMAIDADNPADSVAFQIDADSDTPGGMGSHVNANAASAGALAITVTSADDGAFRAVSGQFLGVSGTYTCGTTDCALSRDSGTDNFTLGAGNWQFTPAAGAMVSVPDQDWMVYGAWMTTPDNPAGPHRIGQFYNGFDVYDAGSNFDATNMAGLHGTAAYSGGATGVYVDGMASGLFTATATLTANFDVNGDGTDDATDYMISGRIHDFRGADGVYLGSDTAADPNDPDAGGENDWVVLLGASDIEDLATASNTTGSADGLPWTGMWSGRLFGPATDGTDAIAPSGVAGRFSASTTAITGPPAIAAGNTAVTGVFGATR